MDHVIEDLKRWLAIYEEDEGEDRDERAILCIKKSLKELNKYYSKSALNQK